MLFNSINFIVFIILFIPLYFVTRGKIRVWLSLISSYFFYGCWDYRYLLLILVLTLVNYYCAINISTHRNVKKKQLYLSISIVVSLLILGFFKYYNFFIYNLNSILAFIDFDNNLSTLNIILPVGISFYTFQAMSYTIDVYRNKLEPEQSLLIFSTYIAFFPQLVAGPIIRATCFIPQLSAKKLIHSDRIINGIYMVVWGFFLKLVIADSLAMVVDIRFENPEVHNALSVLIGVVFYAFQIYGDFAGYSLIAIGIAHILGFNFPDNFDRPYFSKNISEFWQRWHISFSSWLRDYIYISIGGNRSGKILMYRNILITMLLCGLWHGAGWNFIIWGGINGIFIITHRLFNVVMSKIKFSTPSIGFVNNIFLLTKILITFSFVCLGWIFFRSNNLYESLIIINKIRQFNDYHFFSVTQKIYILKGTMLIGFLVFVEGMSLMYNTKQFLNEYPNIKIVWIAFILVLISFFGTFENNAFIYFQF